MSERHSRAITRRNFVSAAAALGASLGLAGCAPEAKIEEAPIDEANPANRISGGKWVPSACWHNCGGRCPNWTYVKDGIAIAQKGDTSHEDTPNYPQRRNCGRGRATRKMVYSDARIKYPMKRKNWSPDNPNGELRGIDEWERISWDEALKYVADQLLKARDSYGNQSILYTGMEQVAPSKSKIMDLLRHFGGYFNTIESASFGTYIYPYTCMLLGMSYADMKNSNDRFDLLNSDYIVLYGCNVSWASPGNPSYALWQAKEAGAEFVHVGPSYNNTAALLNAKWIRVRPGMDIPFLLAVAYQMVIDDESQGLIDWDLLNKCAVGFDTDHLPADAKSKESFKDYLLGAYDGLPKTPEWASELCGTPVEDIIWYAHMVGKQNNVSLLHGYAPARANCTEDFPQLFMTIGLMGGHIGKPGNSCGSAYHANAGDDTGRPLVQKGSTGEKLPPNPCAKYTASVPEIYKGILEGRVSSYDPYDIYAKGVTEDNLDPELLSPDGEVDIHVIVHAYRNFLQTSPGIKEGIEAMRKVDFIVDIDYDFNLTAQYSDILLPASTKWERFEFHNYLGYTREHAAFHDKVIEPLFESKSDHEIGEQLATLLGLDPQVVYPESEEQRYINFIATTQVITEDGAGYETLVGFNEEEAARIKETYGATAPVQEGRISFTEIMEKGIYSVERYEGDPYGNIAYKAFVEDPENNPLPSKSGKFEIYCQDKADILNTMAVARRVTDPTFKPYPTYRPSNVLGYEDPLRESYPYQIYNPHYLRRSHSEFDNVEWLRSTFPNPVFINADDAAEKGVSDGDTVIITAPNGAQVLRCASLTHRLIPKTMALPHGAWSMIDENGVDTGGGDNYLLSQVSSVTGVSGYNTNLVNFEKYSGDPLASDGSRIPSAPTFEEGSEQ